MLITVGGLSAQQYESFKDPRDGRVYKTVKIGNQVWMAENLNTDRFRNGDIIPNEKTMVEWLEAGEHEQPSWCYWNNTSYNGAKLYNWYAVNDPRGLAPEGWHIPTGDEWARLIDYLGGEDKAGSKMKSKSGWIKNGNGTNSCGLSALPGGYRSSEGANFRDYYDGYWWTSTESGSFFSSSYTLYFYLGGAYKQIFPKNYALSIRCVKD